MAFLCHYTNDSLIQIHMQILAKGLVDNSKGQSCKIFKKRNHEISGHAYLGREEDRFELSSKTLSQLTI